MHVKKRKIISLFHLGIKVGYLFITRKIVTRSDIGNSYDLVSKTYQQEYLKIMHTYNDILLNHLIKHISKGRILDLAGGFRVIIMTQANSQVNTRVLELLPKFKIKKMNSWCAV